ncbi:aldolase/citrate lyase family protein [Ornithinimicrobium faecis]|uniref:Aldolase/citrate lyase family protein n=1 Tax=Ornithinimicrobium faecis TaxID=2934158 RepID=A0ABY4YRW2_9MICO|nr:aldolase/citrate lyase family protein [Ornithinimicrobium sp. HY1793]USQ79025.1 aldolase/citrate lyase family protein [Ornithinimicrobium sp. HY1793]
MSARTLEQLIAGDGTPVGTWVKLSAPEGVELMALAGFDFLVLDLEHSPMSLETAAQLIAVARGHDIVPFVRTPDHTQSWIQRCLDAGAAGVLVPHVDTADEAAAVVAAARHEPAGRRGVGPTSRAGDWGLVPMGDYLQRSTEQGVIVQLESPTALENVAAIAASGVSALFVGPADLSVAMGVPVTDPAVREAMGQALAAAHDAGLACGTAVGDPAQARALAQEGFDFVMVSNDATILGLGARNLISTFHSTV